MGIWRCERRGIGFIEMWKKGFGAVLVDSLLDASETARSQEPFELYVYLKSATCSRGKDWLKVASSHSER